MRASQPRTSSTMSYPEYIYIYVYALHLLPLPFSSPTPATFGLRSQACISISTCICIRRSAVPMQQRSTILAFCCRKTWGKDVRNSRNPGLYRNAFRKGKPALLSSTLSNVRTDCWGRELLPYVLLARHKGRGQCSDHV